MSLPPHLWDDPAYRAQIHQTFDFWFIAHMAGDRVRAHKLHRELERLTAEAEMRRHVVLYLAV